LLKSWNPIKNLNHSGAISMQAIRLEKKISLEQVSQQTRIGLGNLLLIEQEDHERLPAEVYVKGFLRAYAKSVGADGDEVIRRYESCHEVPCKKYPVQTSPATRQLAGHGGNLCFRWFCLFVSSGCASSLLFSFDKRRMSDKPLEQRTASPKTSKLSIHRLNSSALKPAPSPPNAVPEKLLLHVTAMEDTWLKAHRG
jgi:cytoskeleton protein RodZ